MKLATPCMEMSRNYFLLCVSLAHSNYFMLHFLGARRRRPNESEECSLPGSAFCVLTSAKADGVFHQIQVNALIGAELKTRTLREQN
jgi:hypothetical protein